MIPKPIMIRYVCMKRDKPSLDAGSTFAVVLAYVLLAGGGQERSAVVVPTDQLVRLTKHDGSRTFLC